MRHSQDNEFVNIYFSKVVCPGLQLVTWRYLFIYKTYDNENYPLQETKNRQEYNIEDMFKKIFSLKIIYFNLKKHYTTLPISLYYIFKLF